MRKELSNLYFIILTMTLLNGGYLIEVLQTPFYTGNEELKHISYLNETAVYSAEDSLIYTIGNVKQEIKVTNVKSISCYKDASSQCLVAGNMIVSLVKLLSTGKLEESKTYNLLPDKPQSSMDTLMKVVAIPQSDYFLTASTVNLGIMRWKKDIDNSYSKLAIEKEFEIDSFIYSLSLISISKYAMLSYYYNKGVYIFDFTTMKKVKIISEPNTSLLTPLTGNLEKNQICIAEENSLAILQYSDGTLINQSESYYYILQIQNIEESDYVITAEDTMLNVYNAPTSLLDHVFQYNFNKSIKAFDHNQELNAIFIGGQKFGIRLTLNTPSQNECHPNCDSACESAFSAGGCSSCAPGTTEVGSLCKKNTITTPLGGKFTEGTDMGVEEEIVIEKTKKALLSGNLKFVLIFFGVLVLVVLYCLCRCLSKGRKKDKVSQQSVRGDAKESQEFDRLNRFRNA